MSLLAWYKLNGNVTDASGNGFHGIAARDTSLTYAVGKVGGAYNANGSSDFVTIPDISENLSALSACAWVKTTDSGFKAICGHFQSTTNHRMWMMHLTNPGWSTAPDGNEFAVSLYNNGYSTDSAKMKSFWVDENIADGTWHHLGFTWDAGTLLLYIDGIVQTTEKYFDGSFSTIFNSASSVSIGAVNPDSGGLLFFAGTIDDLRIYNEVLSAWQIKAIYNFGKGSEECQPWQRLIRRTIRPVIRPLIGV